MFRNAMRGPSLALAVSLFVMAGCDQPTAPLAVEQQHAMTGGPGFFAVAGQSNGRVGYFGYKSFATLKSELATSTTAWPLFVRECERLSGQQVGILNAGVVGGSSQTWASDQSRDSAYRHSSWDRRGTLFYKSVASIDSVTATHGLQLRGVIWSQGEADAGAINKGHLTRGVYEKALRDMIGRYREHYGANLPFYIIRTGRLRACTPEITAWCTDLPGGGGETPGHKAVRAAQTRVADQDPLTDIFDGTVTFPARGLMGDNVHYSAAGYQIVGRSLAPMACL